MKLKYLRKKKHNKSFEKNYLAWKIKEPIYQ